MRSRATDDPGGTTQEEGTTVDALLLIDLQVGLCTREGVAGAALADVVAQAGTLTTAGRCLAAARSAGVEVVHVRLAFDPGYARRTNRTERFGAHEAAGRFLEGSADVAFCKEVLPRAGELVVSKGSVSPFASTGLEAFLHARGRRSIAVCGVATHLAVESAAREAADRGVHVTVVGDACAAPADLHQHSLQKVLPAFSDVVSADVLVQRLEQRSAPS